METIASLTIGANLKSPLTFGILSFGLTLFCTAMLWGQKHSVEVDEFSMVLLNGKGPVFLVKHDSNMVVFDGYPMDNVCVQVSKGILFIALPAPLEKADGTVVILYNPDHDEPPMALYRNSSTNDKNGKSVPPAMVKS